MIAELIGGTVVGNPSAAVSNFAKIEEGRPGCISFLANEKYENYIYSTQSTIVLVNDSFEPKNEISLETLRDFANTKVIKTAANTNLAFNPNDKTAVRKKK